MGSISRLSIFYPSIPADLVFGPTLAYGDVRFGCSGTPTTGPLAREAPFAPNNGRYGLLLGRAMIARTPTPELTWILLASSAMD